MSTNLEIGCVKVDVVVLTTTLQTTPFRSGKQDSTFPISQEDLGAVESTTRTMSSTHTFLWGCNHFCRSWRRVRYSLDHLCQKTLLRCWTWRQHRLAQRSLSAKSPGGREGWALSRRRWFGVRESRSLGSVEHLVSGRPLRVDSTSARRVIRPSSVSACSWVRPRMTLRIERIRRSQNPPWCDAPGALKRRSISFWSRCDWMWERFHPRMACQSSLWAPTILVPLSDLIILTWPRRAVNRLRAFKKGSVSSDAAISMCTARDAEQVKIAP